MDKDDQDTLPKQWLKHWRDPKVQRNSVITSLVVGSVLLAINQSHRLLEAQLSLDLILKSLLTYAVPYFVASFSSVQSQIRVRSGLQAPEAGRYRCESCLQRGQDHDILLKEGDLIPPCDRDPKETEFTLID